MMTCQLDSKTKQLGHRRKRLWRAVQPIFGPRYGFSLGISFLRLSGLGQPILVANSLEWFRYTAGAGLVSRCRARHFCRVDHTSHPVVTLVSSGKQHAALADYSFIFRWL